MNPELEPTENDTEEVKVEVGCPLCIVLILFGPVISVLFIVYIVVKLL